MNLFRNYLSFVYDRTARLLVTDLTHVAQEMDFLTLQFVQYRERMCVCHDISLSCNFSFNILPCFEILKTSVFEQNLIPQVWQLIFVKLLSSLYMWINRWLTQLSFKQSILIWSLNGKFLRSQLEKISGFRKMFTT